MKCQYYNLDIINFNWIFSSVDEDVEMQCNAQNPILKITFCPWSILLSFHPSLHAEKTQLVWPKSAF
jgi:hypothetical protein